jgi:diacylglycerol kinase family enzyme
MGFDASVVNNVEKFKGMKYIPNKFAYLASVLDTAKDFKNLNLRIVVDQKEINTEAFMVAIANGKYYGGGIKIAPESDLKDGLLDVLIVRDITRGKIMKFLPKVIPGKHMDLDEVTLMRARTIDLYSDEPVFINIDGELEARREAHFKVEDTKVRFIIPKNSF